ncbi:MAG: prolyl oligopeptidase family serine peptidase, partial [Pseudomonadota bacterium]
MAQPPVEVYGQLPLTRSMSISPNSKLVSYLSRQEDGTELAVIYDLENKAPVSAVGTSETKARSIDFAGNDFAILRASDTTRLFGFRGQFEYSAAFSLDLKNKKIRQLLSGSDDLFPAQSGLGRIIGIDESGERVYMPAYIGSRGSDPSYGVMRVSLKTGRGRVSTKGRAVTRDWIVDKKGEPLAIEDYNNKNNRYTLRARRDGKYVSLVDVKAEIPPMSLVGIRTDGRALIVSSRFKGQNTNELSEIDILTGKVTTAFRRDDREVDYILRDLNQRVIGVQYSGLYPAYDFYDPDMSTTMAGLVDYFAGSSVSLESFSSDLNTIIIHVSGGDRAPAFYQFGREGRRLVRLASEYDGITDENVMPTVEVTYPARDGEKIPGVLTYPRGWNFDRRLPTLIMPHGGPEAHDSVRFDWMAQFFASRGYLVLQPNFRGSDGFGAKHKLAGRGEWGRGVMQHDVTDGLNAMIKTGWADADRVCIVGASYGGYAALAGGAFTPKKYKCIAAVAPVTDLVKMIFDERRDSGSDSWVVTYWKLLIGDPRSE